MRRFSRGPVNYNLLFVLYFTVLTTLLNFALFGAVTMDTRDSGSSRDARGRPTIMQRCVRVCSRKQALKPLIYSYSQKRDFTLSAMAATSFKNVTIIGCGLMGSGIAQVWPWVWSNDRGTLITYVGA